MHPATLLILGPCLLSLATTFQGDFSLFGLCRQWHLAARGNVITDHGGHPPLSVLSSVMLQAGERSTYIHGTVCMTYLSVYLGRREVMPQKCLFLSAESR